DDVAGEVVRTADQRRTDAVGVDRHPVFLELMDLLEREAARDDDADAVEAVVVQRAAHLPHEPRVDAGRAEVAHLTPERTVDERFGGVEAHAPETRAESVRNL